MISQRRVWCALWVLKSHRPYTQLSTPPTDPPLGPTSSSHSRVVVAAAAAAVATPPKQTAKSEKDRRRRQQVALSALKEEVEWSKVVVMSCRERPVEQMLRRFPTARRVDPTAVCFSDLSPAQLKSVTFVFSYGVAVFWGCSGSCQESTLAIVNRSEDDSSSSSSSSKLRGTTLRKAAQQWGSVADDDLFMFRHEAPGSVTTTTTTTTTTTAAAAISRRVRRDGAHFVLLDHSLRLKLVLSHAFAQSVRLDVLEKRFRLASEATRDVAVRQSLTGKVPDDLGEADIISLIGALEAILREVNVDGHLRSASDLFWDEDELEDILLEVRDYLDLPHRAEFLTEQIGFVVQQMRRLLQEKASQHSVEEHKGAIRLEWYIILLIAYEAIVIKFLDVGTAVKGWLSGGVEERKTSH